MLIQEARNRTTSPPSRLYEQNLADGDGLRFCKLDMFEPDGGWCAVGISDRVSHERENDDVHTIIY